MIFSSGNVVGNYYDKYGTKNPIERALMGGFLGAVRAFYARVAPETVLEVGCGEGHLAQHLVTRAGRPKEFVACDLEIDNVASGLDPLIAFRRASIYGLPFETKQFDLVVCCEVLEHLEEPGRGLQEVARVARRGVIVSAPREPLWRAMNLMRGKYVGDLGNTPGHIQHFGARSLERLVAGQLRVVVRRRPPPWTVILGEPRGEPRGRGGDR